METEIRLDDTADLALFELIGSVFKWLDHHALAEKFQIAATLSGAGVVRIFFGNLGKISWRFLDDGQQFFCFGFGSTFFGSRRIFASLD